MPTFIHDAEYNLLETVGRELGIDTRRIKASTLLSSIAAHRLTELLAAMESQFRVRISQAQLSQLATFGDLLRLLGVPCRR
jgi:acyl carrier protein